MVLYHFLITSLRIDHQCNPSMANQLSTDQPAAYDAYELTHTHIYVVLTAQGGAIRGSVLLRSRPVNGKPIEISLVA